MWPRLWYSCITIDQIKIYTKKENRFIDNNLINEITIYPPLLFYPDDDSFFMFFNQNRHSIYARPLNLFFFFNIFIFHNIFCTFVKLKSI